MCKAALPRRLSSTEATVILILNIFFPGVGTMVASIMGRACRCDTFLVGILQLITAPLIVGWIWSIWWGVAACGRVGNKREVDDAPTKSRESNHEGRTSDKQSNSHHSERITNHSEHTHVEHPQQGFPQAYPEPTYPAATFQQPYQKPYPGNYPPTQPPV